MLPDRLDADREQRLERRRRGDPVEPGRRRIQPPGGVGDPERSAVVRPVRVVSGVPAGEQRLGPVEQPLRRRHERRAARGEQPLVARADERVEARRVEREPAAGLGRVDDRQRLVRGGRPEHGVDVGDRSVRRLDGAEGHDVRQLVHRVGEPVERDRHHVEPLLVHQEREQQGGEIDLRHDHAGAVGHRGRDYADEGRDGRSRRHPLGWHADQPAEQLACPVGRLVPVLPARPAVPPVVERDLERVERRPRRQPVARGVEIGTGRRPELAGGPDRERS